MVENKIISKSGIMKTEEAPLFPVKEDDFDNLFIDYENYNVVNSTLLSRRLNGIVSYNGDYNEEDYPKLNEMNYVHLKMTNEQYIKYKEQREIEIELELKAHKRRNKKGTNSGSGSNTGKKRELNDGNVYRAFTRAVCNFAFPQKIQRPYPSTMHTMQKEMDLEDFELEKVDDDEEPEPEADADASEEKGKDKDTPFANKARQYLLALKQARKDLLPYLTKDNIAKYSPKYVEILNNIKLSPGPVLVYSFFKTVEGMELFSQVMQNYNYAELKVIKHKNGEYNLDFTKIHLPHQSFHEGAEGSFYDRSKQLSRLICITEFVTPCLLPKAKD
jgi:hypothetical protein